MGILPGFSKAWERIKHHRCVLPLLIWDFGMSQIVTHVSGREAGIHLRVLHRPRGVPRRTGEVGMGRGASQEQQAEIPLLPNIPDFQNSFPSVGPWPSRGWLLDPNASPGQVFHGPHMDPGECWELPRARLGAGSFPALLDFRSETLNFLIRIIPRF